MESTDYEQFILSLYVTHGYLQKPRIVHASLLLFLYPESIWALFIYSVIVSAGKSWRGQDRRSRSHHHIFYQRRHFSLSELRVLSLGIFQVVPLITIYHCRIAGDLILRHLQFWSDWPNSSHTFFSITVLRFWCFAVRHQLLTISITNS